MQRLLRSAVLTAMAALTTTAAAQNFGINLVGSWNQDPGQYADVWGEGDLAFIGKYGNSRVLTLDVSDPTSPTLISTYQVPPPNHNCSAQDVKTANGLMFIGLEADGNAGAQIVDIRDPAQPQHLVDITIQPDTHNVFFADGWLYLADSRSNRFAVLDLRNFDPDNPPAEITTPTWWVNNVGSRFVHDITVQGDRLYAGGWDGIYIYDVSDIANQPPVLLGSAPGSAAHSAWATQDGRFIVTAEERENGGIKLYEVAPNGSGVTVTLRDEYAPAGRTAHNPIVLGDRVYCSWYGLGCLIFEIDRNTASFVHVGAYDTGTAWGVYPLLGTDRILISDMSNGLVVLATCRADINGDGVINTLDFVEFLNAFSTGDDLADWNDDGTINTLDFLAYLNDFNAGC